MKRLLALMLLSACVLVPSLRADGPDDDYVAIYGLIQQGDALNEKGDITGALQKYHEAEGSLTRFKKAYPDAYPKVVKYRMDYLESKIDELSAKAKPATNAAPASSTNVPSNAPSSNPPAANSPAAPSAEMQNELKGLQDQVKQLQDDRATLEAKLKEALAARPAEVDPQELAKAREQITNLQKENELLKATVQSDKTNKIAAGPSPDMEKLRLALADANRKVDALSQANAALQSDKQSMQEQMKKLGVNDSATSALREENQLLKKQLAELKSKGAPAEPKDALQKQLKEAQAQLAALQSDEEVWHLEKMALQNRVKQLMNTNSTSVPAQANTSAPATSIASSAAVSTEPLDSVTASRIAQLEAQRDELQKSLEAATRDAQGRRKGRITAERIEEMSRQLAGLRARIVVFEAAKIPYTPEEQALFGTPDATLTASAHSSGRKRKEISAAAQVLVSEGEQFYVAGDFPKAEAKYKEALKQDPKNPAILADLASIQLEQGHIEDAEKNINAAIAVDPNDDFNLLTLGRLKYDQKKYDEAFDALSRAAEMNPQNARIQNALGLTLAKKGLRGPAETAFRKAVQIDPGFADAHANLAIVYATQQPPLLELARWHYQKALAAGHKPSPGLEKLLDPTRTAAQ